MAGEGRPRPARLRAYDPPEGPADDEPATLSARALAQAIELVAMMRIAYRRRTATRDDLLAAMTRLRRIADRVDLRSGTITDAEARTGWSEDVASGSVLED